MVFEHQNFWLMFLMSHGGGGGCSGIVVLAGFCKSAPGLCSEICENITCTLQHLRVEYYGITAKKNVYNFRPQNGL